MRWHARLASRGRVWVAGTALATAALFGTIGIRQWEKPYPVPVISAQLTVQDAALTFRLERATVRALRENVTPSSLPGFADYQQGLRLLAEGEVDRAVESLAQAVRAEPRNLVYGNTLRRTLAREGRWGSLVGIWEAFDLGIREIRLHKALAMVDAMANPSLADASIGRLSMRSMSELTTLVEANPYDWLAHYGRGLNNLYWPVSFRRIDKAIADLGYAVAIVEMLNLHEQWMAVAYATCGDALVKSGRAREGLAVWRRGLARFPGSMELQRRVAAGPEHALEVVRSERGTDAIQRPAADVADLAMIWDGMPLP